MVPRSTRHNLISRKAEAEEPLGLVQAQGTQWDLELGKWRKLQSLKV